jgi:hypothetical protein
MCWYWCDNSQPLVGFKTKLVCIGSCILCGGVISNKRHMFTGVPGGLHAQLCLQGSGAAASAELFCNLHVLQSFTLLACLLCMLGAVLILHAAAVPRECTACTDVAVQSLVFTQNITGQ